MEQVTAGYNVATRLGRGCASVLCETFDLSRQFADVPVSCALIRARLGMTDPSAWEEVVGELMHNGHANHVASVDMLTLTPEGAATAVELGCGRDGDLRRSRWADVEALPPGVH
jgi:hypothetical protein